MLYDRGRSKLPSLGDERQREQDIQSVGWDWIDLLRCRCPLCLAPLSRRATSRRDVHVVFRLFDAAVIANESARVGFETTRGKFELTGRSVRFLVFSSLC